MNGSPLWTASQAAAAAGGQAAGDWRADGVSIDSRTLAPGDLFVAIEGPDHDGHAFVAGALAGGAAAAMVHRTPDALPDALGADARMLAVGDTLVALTALGAASRDRTQARIAAVTGSAGKTGTKEALGHALARQAPTAISTASYNNHWGVPLSLARMPRQAAYGIFEIGMNHPGEIAPLSRLVRPHVAIITNVEPAHTAFFDSLDGVADAKAEIFEGLEPGGTCVLNRDNRYFERLSAAASARAGARIASFGTKAADYRARDIALGPDHSIVEADLAGRRIDYRIAVPGRHWVLNSLAVLAAADALGADVALAAASFADLPALAGRGRSRSIVCPGGAFTLIDESYNANPASVRAAIETLGRSAPARGGRRVAVLGSMRELGAESDALHAALAEPLIENGIDLVHAAGDMRLVFERLPEAMRGASADSGEAIAASVAASVAAGDVVMVKGSNASRMEAVIERLVSETGEVQASHAL